MFGINIASEHRLATRAYSVSVAATLALRIDSPPREITVTSPLENDFDEPRYLHCC